MLSTVLGHEHSCTQLTERTPVQAAAHLLRPKAEEHTGVDSFPCLMSPKELESFQVAGWSLVQAIRHT